MRESGSKFRTWHKNGGKDIRRFALIVICCMCLCWHARARTSVPGSSTSERGRHMPMPRVLPLPSSGSGPPEPLAPPSLPVHRGRVLTEQATRSRRPSRPLTHLGEVSPTSAPCRPRIAHRGGGSTLSPIGGTPAIRTRSGPRSSIPCRSGTVARNVLVPCHLACFETHVPTWKATESRARCHVG